MPVIEIKPDVYWNGVNDRKTDLFESLWPITREGVAYNAYLVNDDKKVIIDTAKSVKTNEFLNRVPVDTIGDCHRRPHLRCRTISSRCSHPGHSDPLPLPGSHTLPKGGASSLMHGDHKFRIKATIQDVWEFLLTPEKVGSCIPGCEKIEPLQS